MMKLKLLLEELKKARHDKKAVDSLIQGYIESEDDANFIGLVNSLMLVNTLTMVKIIDIYLDELYRPTVEEVIKGGRYSMFEFDNETFTFSAIVDNSPVFSKLGSVEAIVPPFKLSDRVRRCF